MLQVRTHRVHVRQYFGCRAGAGRKRRPVHHRERRPRAPVTDPPLLRAIGVAASHLLTKNYYNDIKIRYGSDIPLSICRSTLESDLSTRRSRRMKRFKDAPKKCSNGGKHGPSFRKRAEARQKLKISQPQQCTKCGRWAKILPKKPTTS